MADSNGWRECQGNLCYQHDLIYIANLSIYIEKKKIGNFGYEKQIIFWLFNVGV